MEELATGPSHLVKLHLLRSFDPAAGRDLDVPDPYYGGDGGFSRVYDICHSGCIGLLARVHPRTARHVAPPGALRLALERLIALASSETPSIANAKGIGTSHAVAGSDAVPNAAWPSSVSTTKASSASSTATPIATARLLRMPRLITLCRVVRHTSTLAT